MVFGLALAATTLLAPASSVVTGPMLSQIAGGATGAAVGSKAVGVGTAVALKAAATTAGATAGEIAVGVSAGVTGGVVTGVNLAIGPPGWIVLGTSFKQKCGESEDPDLGSTSQEDSWTCWKKVIRDSSDKDEGVPLCYILQHENVKCVSNYENHYIVENIWGEMFKIYCVQLLNGDIAAHAENCS